MFLLRSNTSGSNTWRSRTNGRSSFYQRTIFNFDVLSGYLDIEQTVGVEVFDISPDPDADTDPISLIEHLIDTLATSANVDWDRLG